MHKFFYTHMSSNLLGINLEMKLQSHMIALCLTFWVTAKLFCKVTALWLTQTFCKWKIFSPISSITNNFAKNMLIHVSLCTHTCVSLKDTSRSRTGNTAGTPWTLLHAAKLLSKTVNADLYISQQHILLL